MSKINLFSILTLIVFLGGCGGGGGSSDGSNVVNEIILEDLEKIDLRFNPFKESFFEIEIEMQNAESDDRDLRVIILLDTDSSGSRGLDDFRLEFKLSFSPDVRIYTSYDEERGDFRRFISANHYIAFGFTDEDGFLRIRFGLDFPFSELRDSLAAETLFYNVTIQNWTKGDDAELVSEDHFPEVGTVPFLGTYEIDEERDYVGVESSSDIRAVRGTNLYDEVVSQN